MYMWIYLRAANRLVPQQTLQEPSTCQQVRLHKHVANTRILGQQRTAENFERLVALMLLAFQALPSLWRQMHPPFRLQAVEGSLPSEAKYGRDEKSCRLHIWCSINRTMSPFFSSSGSVTLGYAFFSAQPAWENDKILEPTVQFFSYGDCGGSWPAGSLWYVLETFQISQ